jgi:hypothetical protein
MSPFTKEQAEWIFDQIRMIREQFERELDQGVLKRDLYQSVEAMGGRDACDRLKRDLGARIDMLDNRERVKALEIVHREQRRVGRKK